LPAENPNATVKRVFSGFDIIENSIRNSSAYFLGKAAENATCPIVIEFANMDNKSTFMKQIKEGGDDLPFNCSIHWPKDIMEKIAKWKPILESSKEHTGSQFYFSYSKSKIKVSKCPKGTTERKWTEILNFPIPPKNGPKVFKGLPEIFGGPPAAQNNGSDGPSTQEGSSASPPLHTRAIPGLNLNPGIEKHT
jgi:hypothetical protein